MLDIPSALQEQFEEYLQNKPIPNSSRGAYKKWLRYYLDFCRKYNFPPIRKESLPHFIQLLYMGYWFLKNSISNTEFAMPGLGQGSGPGMNKSADF